MFYDAIFGKVIREVTREYSGCRANVKQKQKYTLVNNNFPNKLIDQQIKLYLHNIHKNNNTINYDNINRINLYYRNQMHYNFKLDEQVKVNIIKRHIKPTEKQRTNKTYYQLHKN